MKNTINTNSLYVGSVGKVFAVLNCFKAGGDELSLMEVVQQTGFDKSAAQRYLYTLSIEGYLEQNPLTRRYKLGKQVLDLTFHFLRSNSLVESLNPIMLDLSRATGEKISLSLLDDQHLVHVMRHQTNTEHYHASLVGRRVPLFCTAGGRAVLSHFSKDELESYISSANIKPWTQFTMTSIPKIESEVQLARKRGYGLVHNEFIFGEVGLGVAVLRPDGTPIGALHLSGSSTKWGEVDYADKFAPYLLNAIGQFEQRNRFTD